MISKKSKGNRRSVGSKTPGGLSALGIPTTTMLSGLTTGGRWGGGGSASATSSDAGQTALAGGTAEDSVGHVHPKIRKGVY